MKKTVTIIALALFGLSLTSLGQSTPNKPGVMVTMGNIAPIYENGISGPIHTTLNELLANKQLKMPPPACDIQGFTFRMFPDGQDLIGPFTVKGNELTPEIISLLQHLKDPQGRIFIDKIEVNCGGSEMRGTPILLHMAPNKK